MIIDIWTQFVRHSIISATLRWIFSLNHKILFQRESISWLPTSVRWVRSSSTPYVLRSWHNSGIYFGLQRQNRHRSSFIKYFSTKTNVIVKRMNCMLSVLEWGRDSRQITPLRKSKTLVSASNAGRYTTAELWMRQQAHSKRWKVILSIMKSNSKAYLERMSSSSMVAWSILFIT